MTEIIWPLFSLKLFSYVLLSVSAFSSFFFSSFCWPCSCSIDACLASAASESHTHTTTQITMEYCGRNMHYDLLQWMGAVRMRVQTEDPLVSKWCNATFLQIWWRNKLIFVLDGLRASTFSVNYSSKAFRSHRVWTAVQWHISPVHVGPLCCSPVSAVGLVSEWRSLCSSPDLGYRLALCMPGQATWLYFLRGTQWHFYNATDKCVYMLYQIAWFPAHTPSALMLPSVWSVSDQRLHRFL